ncbi:ATP-dependent RNA helicase DHX8 isoform 2 [Aphelenchoides avenae]|nr:ATP-dependent RNA helicase DHX8 isoform 2 [Aphelenchus avenae]
MASAKRVAEELGCRVGEEVGYRVRFDNSSSDRTRIVFITDGTLVQELLADEMLMKYSFIILDEVHVRSANLDFLVPMLRRTCQQRKEPFNLLISSATIDVDRFADFFGAPGPISPSLPIQAPVIVVGGHNYMVEVFHDTSVLAAVERYKEHSKVRSELALAAAFRVHKIVRRRKTGDILVFLPGQEEIEQCCDLLRHVAAELNVRLDIRPLLGALPYDVQKEALKPAQDGRRRVVVATNIAETSLTIDGIIHVIDSGVSNEPLFQPETGFHWITKARISKYSSVQRAGRAGRTAPGRCYRLYTHEQYDEMPTSDSAEITRADFAEILLRMSKLEIANVLDFDFMQKPSEKYFIRAVKDLVAIGAMNASGRITPHGEKIMELALEPCLGNALLRSAKHGCAEEMLVIVAIISVDYAKVFYKPQDKRLREAAIEKWRHLHFGAGDHLTLWNVYRKWTTVGGCGRKWCDDNFVYYQTMHSAKKLIDQLRRQLAQMRVPIKSCGSQFERVEAALAESFADKVASFDRYRGYVWLADKPERLEHKVLERPKLVICYKVVVAGERKLPQMELRKVASG